MTTGDAPAAGGRGRTAQETISALGLARHPEGGFYRETFRAPDEPRGASTSILFLLPADVLKFYFTMRMLNGYR